MLWVTVLMIESDVCMVNKPLNLFGKRFRSKAFSAACLSPGQLICRARIGFNFLPTPYYDKASDGGGLGGGGKREDV
jgi:hypothetical protein